VLGLHTDAAIRRFQRFAGLAGDGRVGPATVAALAAPPPQAPPRSFDWPLRAPLSDGFGPRGDRFHAGIDLRAAAGTSVLAAASGEVSFASPYDGYGLLVVIAHGNGLRSFYAHLSQSDVRVGERVRDGQQIGLVGSSGSATGPHLHFELRLRGAAVDPLPALR
jgi:murein DD-endopeptidase MepM/ murein hydrolase activator NlpD